MSKLPKSYAYFVYADSQLPPGKVHLMDSCVSVGWWKQARDIDYKFCLKYESWETAYPH